MNLRVDKKKICGFWKSVRKGELHINYLFSCRVCTFITRIEWASEDLA